jgi:hypothetical protein
VRDVPYREFQCPRCGVPSSMTYGVTTYGCMCRTAATYAPMPPATDGCRPAEMLTEADVRKIVREELTELRGAGK